MTFKVGDSKLNPCPCCGEPKLSIFHANVDCMTQYPHGIGCERCRLSMEGNDWGSLRERWNNRPERAMPECVRILLNVHKDGAFACKAGHGDEMRKAIKAVEDWYGKAK